MNARVESIRVDYVHVPDGRRHVDEAAVEKLCASIQQMGLRTPITVRIVDGVEVDGEQVEGVPVLVTGAHRLEAVRRLGWDHVDCFVFEGDDEIDARLWEIAENLHRAELTVLERSEQIAEWVRLTEEKRESAQSAPKLSVRGREGEGRPESGINAASRELGIERTRVQRAVRIASISEEAKEAARAAGVNTQGALERIARASDQVGEVLRISEERRTPIRNIAEEWSHGDAVAYDAIEQAWRAASFKVRKHFVRDNLGLIGPLVRDVCSS